MERPSESLKSFANRIARVAIAEPAVQVVRLLRLSGLMAGETAVAPSKAAAPEETKAAHVGIWERKEENGRSCFVRRRETMSDWHLWANLGRIEGKGLKRRV